MEKNIIIVEGSIFFGKLLINTIQKRLNIQSKWFKSFKEAKEFDLQKEAVLIAVLN